jgi:hypothetical protein
VKHPEDFCCISLTANSLKRDYPDIFKPETRFPPTQAGFIDWPEKGQGCGFFKRRANPAEAYSA